MDGRITVRFDGGSRGNPGPAAAGVVLEADDGTVLQAFGKFIGNSTSNVAEYRGLIAGLEAAKALGAKHVRVLGDSELVIRQVLGEYRVRHEALKPLHARVMSLLGQFPRSEVGHNRRAHNGLADSLANLAMDKARDVTDDELPGGGGAAAGNGDATDTEGDVGKEYVCPKCRCRLRVIEAGSAFAAARRFTCRCGTPFRPAS